MSRNKRKDFNDSQIMDALDAEDYSIHRAAHRLGLNPSTLHKWVKASDNLRGYIQDRLSFDAVKAREKLEEILSNANALDPRQMGYVIQVCKILLDKAEADKQEISVTETSKVDEELEAKIKKLLGE